VYFEWSFIMDLSTKYLGIDLPHPLMPGASPLAYDLGSVKRLEDAGAAAIVMPSLFEEQLLREQLATDASMTSHNESFAEALSYFPDNEDFKLGPDEYLDKVRAIKSQTDLPVIASLNGMNEGKWLDHAKQIEQAGADALELNVYYVAMDPAETCDILETRTVEMVKHVKATTKLPLAVKLSPFYTSMVNMADRLVGAGADALVIFNRFYQPDINVEELDVTRVNLSSTSELLLRLRWLAILSCKVKTSLAVTGGVHTEIDVVKSVMAGADAVQMVSALLENGPEHLTKVRTDLERWLVEHEYESLNQARGSMNLENCPNPTAYERANYIQVLQSWTA
jgi:dihydroorotate dehydrogenase (fumarate)